MPREKNDNKNTMIQNLLFFREVVQTYELQPTRLPCPSTSLEACSDSCSLTQWCHPTISSSVASFSSFPQSFLPSGSFSMSLYIRWQNIGALSTASVLQLNIQVWFPLGLIVLISLLSKGHWRVFSNKTIGKYPFSVLSLLSSWILTSVHDYWKNKNIDYMDICHQIYVSVF